MTTDDTNGVTISFEVSPQVSGYLDLMVETGLWGDTREEVALNLIREGIRRHWAFISDGPLVKVEGRGAP
jgi:hypothetical protein